MTSKGLEQFVDLDQLREDISINPNTLENAFFDQASMYLHYASLAVKAQYQADRCKQAQAIVEAEIDNRIRDEATLNKVKTTEAQISKEIALDPKFQRAAMRVNEAKMIASLCREAANSFLQRRDMIVQAAKSNLEERRGELIMKEHPSARLPANMK